MSSDGDVLSRTRFRDCRGLLSREVFEAMTLRELLDEYGWAETDEKRRKALLAWMQEVTFTIEGLFSQPDLDKPYYTKNEQTNASD